MSQAKRIKESRESDCLIYKLIAIYTDVMILNKSEKEGLVVKLVNEGRTYREIAKLAHISLRDIGKIVNKLTGNDVAIEEAKKERRLKDLSPYAQAFRMFKDKKDLADVAIELDIKADAILDYFGDYLRLSRMGGLVNMYNELKGDDFELLIHLYRRINSEGLSKQGITELLGTQKRLLDLHKQVDLLNDHIRHLHSKKLQLEKEINVLRTKVDNFDGLSPL